MNHRWDLTLIGVVKCATLDILRNLKNVLVVIMKNYSREQKKYSSEVYELGYIYKLINDKGEIIYIGITSNMEQRMRQHSKTKKWAEVKSILYSGCHTMFDCDILERYLIVKYKPKFNRTHNRKMLNSKLEIKIPEFKKWERKKVIENKVQEFDDVLFTYLLENGYDFSDDNKVATNDNFIIMANYYGSVHRYTVNHFFWHAPVTLSTPVTYIDTLDDFKKYQKDTLIEYGYANGSEVVTWNLKNT